MSRRVVVHRLNATRRLARAPTLLTKKIGNHASDTGELAFEDMRVPQRCMLGQENQRFMYLMQNFQAERLIACASACAGLQMAMDEAIAYGRERKAFGKPIIKREYWQHKFVDLQTKLEAARALTHKAVEMFNEERYVKKEPISFEAVKIISMACLYSHVARPRN